ncbi:MAG: 2-C-methyl-D-erythritol 4-phosphate cytidylyltransferase [bacterium]|nr:2-C-methyl-D-erythritol 4-phosphate cytidylyltransferase [bacterium]
MPNPTVAAILVAAGSGKRLEAASGGKNKVLLSLEGCPLFTYSLRTLANSGIIGGEMVLVHRPDDREEIESHLQSLGLGERVALVPGGRERFDSVHAGLARLADRPPEIVVIHDAARPFVTPEMILESVRRARETGAATVAIPLTDTLKHGEEGFLKETLPRQNLYRIQTPQTFRFDLIWDAYLDFMRAPDPQVTDDCMILERRGCPIAWVMGAESNLKVTTPFDLEIAEALLRKAGFSGASPQPGPGFRR